jgi:hypothetical protein
MRKFASATLIAGAAAATVAIGATPAFAATYTVTNGGVFSSTSTNVQFVDVTTGATFSCTNSSVPGNAPNGTGLSGIGLATLAGAPGNGTFTGCTGTAGSTGTATLTSGRLDANGQPTSAGGVTTGTISQINASLAISSLFGTCNATVAGDLGLNNVSYTNSTSTLQISPDAARPTTLKIVTASGPGCANLIRAGDSTTFQASYKVTTSGSTTGPVISSP